MEYGYSEMERMTKEELIAHKEVIKQNIILTKEKYEAVKAGTNLKSIKTLNQELRDINNKRERISDQMRKIERELEGRFVSNPYQGVYYQRVRNSWMGAETNIHPHVLTAIKKYVKISKLKKEDVEDIVRNIIYNAKQSNDYRKKIVPLDDEYRDLWEKAEKLSEQIKKEDRALEIAKRAFEDQVSYMRHANYLLRDTKRWEKIEDKEKKKNARDVERDIAFSSDTEIKILNAIIEAENDG